MSINLNEYGMIRVAVASPELRIADCNFNSDRIIELIAKSSAESSGIILFPELSITGYSCGDLLFQKNLLESALNGLVRICTATGDYKITAIVGLPLIFNQRLYNVGAVLSNGVIKGLVPKSYLCNYNEYYESRWFCSGLFQSNQSIEIQGKKVPFGTDLMFTMQNNPDMRLGVEICEDLWAVIPPSSYMAISGANVIANLSAGNETLGKSDYRLNLVKNQSARCIAAYLYSSAGPNESSTDLVFSGHSIICENGQILSESNRFSFQSELIFADIDIHRLNHDRMKNRTFADTSEQRVYRQIDLDFNNKKTKRLIRTIDKHPFVPDSSVERTKVCSEIFNMQSTSLIKRLRYTGIQKVVLGISGGLDSTLALLASYKALKLIGLPERNLIAITMPGPGTSDRTKNNAMHLAKILGCVLRVISISESTLKHLADIGHDGNSHDVTFENAQSRERTKVLLDIANMESALQIGTGDLSEAALGWCTYGGDQFAMYNLNSGIPKTLVKYIIEWCSDTEFSGEVSVILKDIINTPISPELIPPDSDGKISQLTESYIGPYELNDFFLYYLIRFGFHAKKILFLANQAFSKDYSNDEIIKWLRIFYHRFFSSQFKRSSMPDGAKIGSVALSPRGDWRMPSDAEAANWINSLD